MAPSRRSGSGAVDGHGHSSPHWEQPALWQLVIGPKSTKRTAIPSGDAGRTWCCCCAIDRRPGLPPGDVLPSGDHRRPRSSCLAAFLSQRRSGQPRAGRRHLVQYTAWPATSLWLSLGREDAECPGLPVTLAPPHPHARPPAHRLRLFARRSCSARWAAQETSEADDAHWLAPTTATTTFSAPATTSQTTIVALEKQWSVANVHKDVSGSWSGSWPTTTSGIEAVGVVQTRAQGRSVTSRRATWWSRPREPTEMKVRLYGDVAVVTGHLQFRTYEL